MVGWFSIAGGWCLGEEEYVFYEKNRISSEGVEERHCENESRDEDGDECADVVVPLLSTKEQGYGADRQKEANQCNEE